MRATSGAQGGRVLAPGQPAKPIQPVDIRDLTAFTLSCLEQGTTGTFNVTAPKSRATFGEMLDACKTVTSSAAELTWVDDAFLVEHDVRQWTEIPLWRTPLGTWQVDSAAALAAGLVCRSIAATVRDTHLWLTETGGPLAYGRQAHHGLSSERVRQLLDAWDQRRQSLR
ncbi:hypothetical protein [Microbispora sp. GKU 823]|uniref:hypothetical protein n=1 Tax=Microbispora sp. GKU 823 TaxID=1652100 RepID=UPI0009A2D7CF|nr:hypothetical protein [Microbispora sp. GKU 823]OPG13117.1 hypothetical protein B1L11_10000 [Microbispora sp. GKU 823]